MASISHKNRGEDDAQGRQDEEVMMDTEVTDTSRRDGIESKVEALHLIIRQWELELESSDVGFWRTMTKEGLIRNIRSF